VLGRARHFVFSKLYGHLKFLSISAPLFLFPLSAEAAEPSNIRFAHQVQLHPIAPLPAIVTFIPEAEFAAGIEQVRGVFLIDGDLFSTTLVKEPSHLTDRSTAPEFRGTVPTPQESLSYQFQIISEGGKAELSERFVVKPSCPGFQVDNADSEVKLLFSSQQQRKRLQVAKESLQAIVNKLEK